MVRITVNGKSEFIDFPTLSYEQVLGIVNMRRADRRQAPCDVLHTVAFSYREGERSTAGTLIPGQRVKVRDGLEIIAVTTGNA